MFETKPLLTHLAAAPPCSSLHSQERARNYSVSVADWSGVSAGELGVHAGVWHAPPALVRRGNERMRVAALSMTFDLTLLKRVKNLALRDYIRGFTGDAPGPMVPLLAALRGFVKSLFVRSGRNRHEENPHGENPLLSLPIS